MAETTNPAVLAMAQPKRIWTPEELDWKARNGCEIQCPCVRNRERLDFDPRGADLLSIKPKYERVSAG